jgi:hypothetical protein
LNIVGVIIFSFVLFGCTSTGSTKAKNVGGPQTLESAVKIVLWEMSRKDKIRLKSTSKDALHKVYSEWAEERYKQFLLNSGGENTKLFESSCAGDLCTEKNASMAIVCGAWNSLNGKPIRKGVHACAVPTFVIEPVAN